MHLALYRSERPERFDELIGQKHIVKILQNQIRTGTVSQAYLFTGIRGTGKTTTARILAKAVNCIGEPEDGQLPCGECANCQAIRDGRFLDVIELDAASNNGVDDLRAIIDSVQYPPTMGRYKVYIIDEVHMLSQAAENAFLKTLEEPPEYAIFILATTNPEKVRATIRSRCMTLNFRRVSEKDLVEGMRRICRKKNVEMTDEALSVVAERADGSVRDALSLLEQCISGGDQLVDSDLVLDYIGSAGRDFYIRLTEDVISRNLGGALARIGEVVREGRDPKQMLTDWLSHYRDLMVVKYVKDTRDVVNASQENIDRLRAQAEKLDAKTLERSIRLLSEYMNLGRYSTQPRILLETAALHLMTGDSVNADPLPPVPGTAGRAAVPKAAAPIRAVRPENTASVSQEPPRRQTVTVNADRAAENIAGKTAEKPAEKLAEKSAAPSQRPAMPEEEPALESDAAVEADSVPSQETAASGAIDLEALWERIVESVSASNRSFKAMVGHHGYIESVQNDEVVIRVRKNKMAFAKECEDLMRRALQQLLGGSAALTILEDDSKARKKESAKKSGSAGSKAGTGNINEAADPNEAQLASARGPSRENPDVYRYPDTLEMGDGFGDEGEDAVIPPDYASSMDASPTDVPKTAPSVDFCPDGPDEADDDEQEEVAEELAESASSLFGVDVKMVDR